MFLQAPNEKPRREIWETIQQFKYLIEVVIGPVNFEELKRLIEINSCFGTIVYYVYFRYYHVYELCQTKYISLSSFAMFEKSKNAPNQRKSAENFCQ